MPTKPTAIDLFCGCGGLTLGLKRAGYAVLAGIDSDALAISTYRRNHRNTIAIKADIRSIDPQDLLAELGLSAGELTLLAGCPPCQGFSSLRTLNGRRNVQDPQNDLVFQFLRFACSFQPTAIMMENVPRLASDPRLEQVKSELNGLGYRCEAQVFDAAQFGVPQRRRRMIFIAIKGHDPRFADPRRRRQNVWHKLANFTPPGRSGDPAHDYRVDRASKVVRLIRRIPLNGGSRGDLPDQEQLSCHQRLRGFHDVYGRMKWEEPAPTITGGCINPSKGRFIHPEEHRAITIREAAVLQGFPKSTGLMYQEGGIPQLR